MTSTWIGGCTHQARGISSPDQGGDMEMFFLSCMCVLLSSFLVFHIDPTTSPYLTYAHINTHIIPPPPPSTHTNHTHTSHRYVKALTEAMTPSGVITEEYQEGLDRLRTRLGLSQESAVQVGILVISYLYLRRLACYSFRWLGYDCTLSGPIKASHSWSCSIMHASHSQCHYHNHHANTYLPFHDTHTHSCLVWPQEAD